MKFYNTTSTTTMQRIMHKNSARQSNIIGCDPDPCDSTPLSAYMREVSCKLHALDSGISPRISYTSDFRLYKIYLRPTAIPITFTFIRHKSRSTISTRQNKNAKPIKTDEHLIKLLTT